MVYLEVSVTACFARGVVLSVCSLVLFVRHWLDGLLCLTLTFCLYVYYGFEVCVFMGFPYIQSVSLVLFFGFLSSVFILYNLVLLFRF